MPESPAGWYPDPFGRHELRHWDGTKWTEHVASRGTQLIDPHGDGAADSTAATSHAAAAWHPDRFNGSNSATGTAQDGPSMWRQAGANRSIRPSHLRHRSQSNPRKPRPHRF